MHSRKLYLIKNLQIFAYKPNYEKSSTTSSSFKGKKGKIRWRIQKIKSRIEYQMGDAGDLGVNDNELKYCSDKIVHYIKQLQLNHNKVTPQGIFHLHNLKWKVLVRIQLMSNKIGNKGCYYLSRMKLSTLAIIFLNNNQISSAGMGHLCKAQWKNLKTIVLYYNRIGEGLKMLTRANWMSMTDLHLSWNELQIHQSFCLILGQWKGIANIGLSEEAEIIPLEKHFQLFKNKYPKIQSFNVVTMIRHMTA